MSNSLHKILIVDDEPGLLFSLVAYLEDEGYQVQGVSTGEEALDILQNETFDAVIVDVRLPKIDGNEVIIRAKKLGSNAHFLIHTGSTEYQLPNQLKQLGFSQDDILLKPLPDLNILCQALNLRLKKE